MDYYDNGQKYILKVSEINDEIKMDKGDIDTNLDKTTIIEFLNDDTDSIDILGE